jgi:hypothetical protein
MEFPQPNEIGPTCNTDLEELLAMLRSTEACQPRGDKGQDNKVSPEDGSSELKTMLVSTKASQPRILEVLDSEPGSRARKSIDIQASVRFPNSDRIRGPDSTVGSDGRSELLIAPRLIGIE